MKKIIKRFIPNRAWMFLKFLKHFYNIPRCWTKGCIKKKEECTKIIFLIQFPEMWNSFKTVYEQLKKRENVDVVILCIPKHSGHNEDKYYKPDYINESFDYLTKLGIESINALKYDKQWIDIESMNPDYVIYTRPYNIHYPEDYRSYNVCRFAKTCYIPYAYNMIDNQFSQTFNQNFINGIYITFVANESRLNICKKEFYFQYKYGVNNFVYKGFPRFDLFTNNIEEKEIDKTFTIAWLPRWAVEDGQATKLSGFIKYSQQMIDFANRYKNIKLIIRPHPLMFINFIKKGVMTQQEVDNFKRKCEDCENILIDYEKDYIPLFNKSDLLIADYTSLLMEFFVTSKPIIYCDNADGLNKEAQKMNDVLYHAKEYEDIEKLVLHIMEGKDLMKAKRKLVIEQLIPKNIGLIGSEIAEYLIEDSNKYR